MFTQVRPPFNSSFSGASPLLHATGTSYRFFRPGASSLSRTWIHRRFFLLRVFWLFPSMRSAIQAPVYFFLFSLWSASYKELAVLPFQWDQAIMRALLPPFFFRLYFFFSFLVRQRPTSEHSSFQAGGGGRNSSSRMWRWRGFPPFFSSLPLLLTSPFFPFPS